MAVPGFQTFLRPILEVLSSSREVAHANLVREVADRLGLTESDRAELLPSGKQRRYSNRIGWAKTYLAKSGLVESPRRGIVRITPRGQSALAQTEPIDMDFLTRFPEYLEFLDRSSDDDPVGPVAGPGVEVTRTRRADRPEHVLCMQEALTLRQEPLRRSTAIRCEGGAP